MGIMISEDRQEFHIVELVTAGLNLPQATSMVPVRKQYGTRLRGHSEWPSLVPHPDLPGSRACAFGSLPHRDLQEEKRELAWERREGRSRRGSHVCKGTVFL